MPILFILVLTAACFPVEWVEWPEPLFGGGREAAATFTLTSVCLSLGAAFALRRWVVRSLRQSPSRKIEVALIYAKLRHRLFFVNVGMVATCLLVFGWGWLIQHELVVHWNGKTLPAPFAELAVPLPYFAILFGAWILYYDAERILHRTTVLGPTEKDYWSRIGYFVHQLRQFALMLIPVLFFVAQQTASRFLPDESTSSAGTGFGVRDWYLFGSLLAMPFLFLLLPLLIKPLLGLRSMPEGPVRSRLEKIARRLHFRYADFLIWHTHGAMMNAMILGLVPRARYVVFTDRLLEDLLPDEVDAVLGHEAGHAKHGHIWLYALFISLSIVILASVLSILTQELKTQYVDLMAWIGSWIAVPIVAIVSSYIFLVFGFLSRRCERQADVYGCRSVSCNKPDCVGHDESTVYPERAKGLCPTGIRACINALERVDLLNGQTVQDDEEERTMGNFVRDLFKWLRAWQHSTISRRVAFLRSLINNPTNERHFQLHVTFLKWGLIFGLLAVLFGLVHLAGWRKIWEAM